ncbi:hypothetical protein EYF80_057587 [Liparis tanakae]|uniref:Uncharacterized protein n=1 Tax=Liparis tanakae TaxID=230148 RepID=A0A4Z2ETY3_9TELE|nr:hypothetical protein EYF80_057587 [Liparis tanakae]
MGTEDRGQRTGDRGQGTWGQRTGDRGQGTEDRGHGDRGTGGQRTEDRGQKTGDRGRAYLCEVSTTERPSRMMLWMQLQSARRALGSMPVVGSSCGHDDGQRRGGEEEEQLFLTSINTLNHLSNTCMLLMIRKTTGGAPIRAMAVESFLMFPPL